MKTKKIQSRESFWYIDDHVGISEALLRKMEDVYCPGRPSTGPGSDAGNSLRRVVP